MTSPTEEGSTGGLSKPTSGLPFLETDSLLMCASRGFDAKRGADAMTSPAEEESTIELTESKAKGGGACNEPRSEHTIQTRHKKGATSFGKGGGAGSDGPDIASGRTKKWNQSPMEGSGCEPDGEWVRKLGGRKRIRNRGLQQNW